MTATTWKLPPASSLPFDDTDVHIWRVTWEDRLFLTDGLSGKLSEGERVRAEKFQARNAYQSFVGCRVALRHLLGEVLDIAPHDVELCSTANGKPQILPTQNRKQIQFNLSH